MNGSSGEMNGSSKKDCILLTGGAGYIGSHTAIELVKAGYDIVIVDNLHNSYMECVKRAGEILEQPIQIYVEDLLNKHAIQQVFEKHKFHSVIHFAGLKAVGESVEKPLMYYRNNLKGTITLLEVMEEFGVYNIVFSSSATVYGNPQYLPLDEKHPTGACTNPYGRSKYMIEEILSDVAKSDKQWNIVSLRYFNPVGAHESGSIGEDPQGLPNNLMPFIAQVAVGRREFLSVFGGDYKTHDGTGVRDYIHVVDLAIGHVKALNKINEKCGHQVYNLGTGTGYSVLDMVKAFEKAAGKKIDHRIVGRRDGDVASCYADPALAAKELNWKAELGLDHMCVDTWRWQSKNPYGFRPESKQ